MSKRNPHDKQRQILRSLLFNARKAKGMTQVQLATYLQKPQSFVSKCESGDRLVDLVETHQICQALSYPFDKFTDDFDRAVNESSADYLININKQKK